MNEGYADLIQKENSIIDEIAPVKEMCIKTTQRNGLMRTFFKQLGLGIKSINALKERDCMLIM